MIERLTVRNYRGRDVPAVLGFALAVGGLVSAVLAGVLGRVGTAGVAADGAALLVFAAGILDDLSPDAPRGIRGHLRALAHGHVSTGVAKAVVVAGSSVVTVIAGPETEVPVRVAGIALVAGAANLWNALDVRPGRSIKFGLLGLPAVLLVPWRLAPFAGGVWITALLVLPWDSGERAMLGDAGSNLLGFAIGVACYHAFPGSPVVWLAAAVALMNVLADTVTLSRLIDAAPPLRWWDGLGRPRD